MLQSVVIMVHVAVALLIIGVVLLQRGKGAEAGTGFGAGGIRNCIWSTRFFKFSDTVDRSFGNVIFRYEFRFSISGGRTECAGKFTRADTAK